MEEEVEPSPHDPQGVAGSEVNEGGGIFVTQGEMDAPGNSDPPGAIVIPVSTGYLIRISVGCVAGLAACLWLVHQGAIPSWIIAVSINVFGLVCILTPVAVSMFELALTPEGLTVRSPLGVRFARWADVDVSLTDAFAYVVVTATHCHQRNWWRARRQNRVGHCVFRIKGAWFGMTSEGLRDLICSYQTRAMNVSANDISERVRPVASAGS